MNNVNSWCRNLNELQQVVPEKQDSLLVSGLNMAGNFALDVASTLGKMGVKQVVKEACKTAARTVVGENVFTPVATYVAGNVGGAIADGAIAIASPITEKVTHVSKQVINGIAQGVNEGVNQAKSFFAEDKEKPEEKYVERIKKIQVEKSRTTRKTIILNVVIAIIAIAAVVGLVAFPPLGAGLIAAAVVIAAVAIGIIAFTSYRAHKESKKCSLLVNVYDAYISHLKNPNDTSWYNVKNAMERMKPLQTQKKSKT